MIDRVELHNFQAHEKLDLPIGRLTCFTGPSNSGKSAVLRAIAGLLRNDAVGPYVRHGAKNLRVVLHLSDGHKVEWKKGKESPSYTITTPDGETTTLKKVGQAVPEEVANVLRMGPIVLEDGTKANMNLHEQADSPFLVFDSAPSVAKVFGELTSAGKLFTAANEGNRRTREDKKRRTLRQEDIERLKQDLVAYEGLDEAGEKLTWVEDRLSEAKRLSEASSSVRELMSTFSSTEKDISSAESLIRTLTPLTEMNCELLFDLNRASATLASLQSDHTSLSASLTENSTTISRLESLEVDLEPIQKLNKAFVEVDALMGALAAVNSEVERIEASTAPLKAAAEVDLDQLGKINTAVQTVTRLLDETISLDNSLRIEDKMIESAQNDLKTLDAALDEFDACPTCGQDLTAEAKEHIRHG